MCGPLDPDFNYDHGSCTHLELEVLEPALFVNLTLREISISNGEGEEEPEVVLGCLH